jgi:sugar lactone lactonase YvrE
MKKRLSRIVLGFLVLVALVLVAVKIIYGGGAAYPTPTTTEPATPLAREIVVTLDFPPGNVAVSKSGRLFVNHHPFAQSHRFGATLFEIIDGKAQPFPDAGTQASLQGVFGMTVDHQERLWTIEPAGLDHATTKLSAYDLATNKRVFEQVFEKGALPFAQDLRVTADGKYVILADTGLFRFTKPSIAVFDTQTRRTRLFLQTHASTQPQDWAIRTPFGEHKLGFGLVNFTVGVDGIEISKDGQWLVYGAMSHARLYRLPMSALLDPAADDASVSSKVEDLGAKPLSDGITVDAQGRVLITDIENGGIVRRESDGRLTRLSKDPKVIWADGVVVAPNGDIVFTDSAIPAYIDQLARPPSRERLEKLRPYAVHRLRASAN